MASKLIKNHSGQALSEYMILTLMIAVASIVMVRSIGSSVFHKLKTVQDNLQNVTIESVQDGH